jgi:hypothetical protein
MSFRRSRRESIRTALLVGALAAAMGHPASAAPAVSDPGTWAPVAPPGLAGLPREDAAAAYDPVTDRVWLFGGYDASACLTDDVWTLNVGDAVPQWTKVTVSGPGPEARSRHTLTLDPVRHRLVVYGGLTACGGGIAGDVWALPLGDTLAWTKLEPTGSEAPRPRERQSAVYDPVRDRIVFFGGFTGDPFTDEVWALNLAGAPSWERLAPAGTGPSPRWLHTATYDPSRDRMLVVGGDLRDANTWALEFSPSLQWSALPIKVGFSRQGHGTVYDPGRDRLVVVAGTAGLGNTNEVWTLGLSGTPYWALESVARTPPAGRVDHVTVYDPARDRVIVEGGNGGLADTWSLSLAAPMRWDALLTPFPRLALRWSAYDRARNRMIVGLGPSGAIPIDRVFALDLGSSGPWRELLPSGTPPPGRDGVSAIVDPVRDRVVLFGGSAAGEESAASDETWSLWLGDDPFWRKSQVSGPPGRRDHAAVYDPSGDRMIVIGGLGGRSDGDPCPGSSSALTVPTWRTDTWAWSLGDSTWTLLDDSAPESYGARAVVDSARHRVLLFGGIHEDWFCNPGDVPPGHDDTSASTVWSLPLGGGDWSTLAVDGAPPGGRGLASMVMDASRARVVVFGGIQRGAHSVTPILFGDAWALALLPSPTWVSLAPAGTPPLARAGAGGMFEPGRSKTWFYGGEGDPTLTVPDGVFDDLWTLTFDHTTPVLMDVEEAEATVAGVRIVWRVTGGGDRAAVESTRDGSRWADAPPVSLDGDRVVFEDTAVHPGERVGYRLRLEGSDGRSYSAVEWLEIPSRVELSLTPPWPNPSRGELAVRLSLPRTLPVRLDAYDVLGRRLASRDLSDLEPGVHRIALALRNGRRAGLYLVQATLGGRTLRTRVIVLD